MSKLSDMLKRLQAFDPSQTFNDLMATAEKEQQVAELVRKRLLQKGEDASGKKLRTHRAAPGEAYAPMTIRLKKEMGREWRHVTLQDTGYFHKSFELNLERDFMNLVADSDKDDGKIEDNVDLTNVLNLSSEEKNKLVNAIRSEYILQTRKAVNL